MRDAPQVSPVSAARTTSSGDANDSIFSQWELPFISASALDIALLLSGTGVGAEHEAPASPLSSPPPAEQPPPKSELHLSVDELMAL